MLKHRFPILHKRLSVALNLLIILFTFLMAINPELGKKSVTLMLILWILTVDYRYLWELLRTNQFFQVVVLFMGFTTLSLLWSSDVSAGLNYLRFYYKFFFVVFIIVATSMRREFVQPLIWAFLAAVSLNIMMSYAIYFEFTNSFFGFPIHGDVTNPIPFQEHHIVYSVFVAFGVLLMLYQAFRSPRPAYKPLFSILTVIMMFNLFISTGRTGLIALVFTTGILLPIYYRKNIKIILASLLLLSTLSILGYQYSSIFHERVDRAVQDIEKIINKDNYRSSWGNRVFAFRVVPDILADTSYLFGTGVGDLGTMVDKHYRSNGWRGKGTVYGIGILHNSFLNIVSTTGLIGLGIFLYLLYLLFTQRYNDPYISYLRYALFGMLIASSFSSEFFVWHGLAYLFGLFFAVLVVSQMHERNQKIQNLQKR